MQSADADHVVTTTAVVTVVLPVKAIVKDIAVGFINWSRGRARRDTSSRLKLGGTDQNADSHASNTVGKVIRSM